MKERPLLPSSESFTTRQDLQGIMKQKFFFPSSPSPKGEIAVTYVFSNIRQNNFTGHKHHASGYETWLGGFGEKMHSEVPFTARGRNIFCQEASPGRLGFIFLALAIFKLFVICICWLCSLCYFLHGTIRGYWQSLFQADLPSALMALSREVLHLSPCLC